MRVDQKEKERYASGEEVATWCDKCEAGAKIACDDGKWVNVSQCESESGSSVKLPHDFLGQIS